MCGILCHVRKKHDQVAKLPFWESLSLVNDARGPDGHREEVIRTYEVEITTRGSVLGLRGREVIQQPLRSKDGRLCMLWNGEVFDSLGPFDPFSNDGLQVLAGLTNSAENAGGNEIAFEEHLNHQLSSIEGPYAFIIYDKETSTLFFGRDTLGRRSLLQSGNGGEELLLCSAASFEVIQGGLAFNEVDCGSLWKVDLRKEKIVSTGVARIETLYTKPHRLRELSDHVKEETVTRPSLEAIQDFLMVLSDSTRRRVQHIHVHGDSRDAQVAVLFSGGLDCTTLAILAHQHIDPIQPIDLLNVAFENPRALQAKAKLNNDLLLSAYDVPDRKTGRQSYAELQRLAPSRHWKFVEIDVSHDDYVKSRSQVESLMEPSASVMDLSIASALYFACRGRGSNGYTSNARVLLSGLGADELLGGYSRHRKAFTAGGRKALVEELQMDLDRLATRNLGRDDRILSSSGKEARYPFLSHSVIDYLAKLPIEIKMDFVSLPAGQGDKMLLRQVAAHLGLKEASLLVKRAIQFGARSAKMEVGQGKILGHEKLKPNS